MMVGMDGKGSAFYSYFQCTMGSSDRYFPGFFNNILNKIQQIKKASITPKTSLQNPAFKSDKTPARSVI